jgi:hypothetical protein
MVTVAGLGKLAGAVYRPAEVIVPQVAPEQPDPLARHVTAAFCIPAIAARNCWVPSTATSLFAGVTLITSGKMMVTTANPDFVLLASEVAVIVICAGVGTTAGAVYRPSDVMSPQLLPEQPTPLRLQVTAVLEVPRTVAVNCCWVPVATFVVVGEILTEIAGRIVT